MDGITWLKGLVAAIVSGVATSILSSGFSSASGSNMNWSQIGSVALGAAITGACLYLKQSPIPNSIELKSISFEPQKTTVTTISTPQKLPTTDKINQ